MDLKEMGNKPFSYLKKSYSRLWEYCLMISLLFVCLTVSSASLYLKFLCFSQNKKWFLFIFLLCELIITFLTTFFLQQTFIGVLCAR